MEKIINIKFELNIDKLIKQYDLTTKSTEKDIIDAIKDTLLEQDDDIYKYFSADEVYDYYEEGIKEKLKEKEDFEFDYEKCKKLLNCLTGNGNLGELYKILLEDEKSSDKAAIETLNALNDDLERKYSFLKEDTIKELNNILNYGIDLKTVKYNISKLISNLKEKK